MAAHHAAGAHRPRRRGAQTSQTFVLVALASSLPMILIYTAFAYWVFRGKIKPGVGYAH